MEKTLDILKIQKTIRKAIRDHKITAKHEEEVLVSLVSVELYLALTAEDPVPPSPKPLKTPKVEPIHA